jgi:hypothetical protein
MDCRTSREEKNHNHSHIHYPLVSAAADDDGGTNDSYDDNDSNIVNSFNRSYVRESSALSPYQSCYSYQ